MSRLNKVNFPQEDDVNFYAISYVSLYNFALQNGNVWVNTSS